MTLVDVKKSINTVLKTNFPKIKRYDDEIKEGFKKPSFFVQLIPVTSDYETVNLTSNSLMVVINYFSENETDVENIKMYDELKKAFGMTLKTTKKILTLKKIRSDTVDGSLQFKFNLDYFLDVKKVDTHEIMRDLEIIQRGEK